MLSSVNDLTIEQGTKWEQSIIIDPKEYDLTDKIPAFKIKNVTEISTILEYTLESGNVTIDPDVGVIDLVLYPDDTTQMIKQGVYTFELEYQSENVTIIERFLRGKVLIIPDPLEE